MIFAEREFTNKLPGKELAPVACGSIQEDFHTQTESHLGKSTGMSSAYVLDPRTHFTSASHNDPKTGGFMQKDLCDLPTGNSLDVRPLISYSIQFSCLFLTSQALSSPCSLCFPHLLTKLQNLGHTP